MPRSIKAPRSKLFASILVILLFSSTATLAFAESQDSDDDGDLQDIEELIAIDEQQEEEEEESTAAPHNPNTHYEGGKKSEAEVWSKARGIVVELNGDTTKRIVAENEYVMVLGYAPWCSRSADLMPKFAEAANVLKGLGSGVLMAKIDADRYPKPAASLGIKGVPSLVLFTNGTSGAYAGGFSMEELVVWIRKKTGKPVVKISSTAEANEFLNQHSTYVVGLFDKFEGLDYEEFLKAAEDDNEFQFVETNDEDIAKLLYPSGNPTPPFFGLVKGEPEHYTSLDGKFTLDNIVRFLDTNKLPLVTLMTELNSARVYSSQKKLQVYVFADADEIKKLLQPLREIARKFISEVLMVAVDIAEENLAKPFLTLFGLEDSEETTVVAFDYKTNSKYMLESDPTSRNIEDFCLGLVKQTAMPYYKSQPIPDNKNASVLTVVGKTFDDLVLQSTKNVLLEVHMPWCMNCETTSKQVEKLAKHFKGLDSLVFARFDASANEHPRLKAEEFPTLLFFPANDKSNPISLPTKSSLKDLAALINKNLKTMDSSSSAIRDEL